MILSKYVFKLCDKSNGYVWFCRFFWIWYGVGCDENMSFINDNKIYVIWIYF